MAEASLNSVSGTTQPLTIMQCCQERMADDYNVVFEKVISIRAEKALLKIPNNQYL